MTRTRARRIPAVVAPREKSGRLVVVALLFAIAIAITGLVGYWWKTRWPDGPIVGIRAVSKDTVLVLRRGERKPRGYGHLMLERRGAPPAWSVRVFGWQVVGEPAALDGATIGGDLVTLRVRDHQGNLETHAFRRSDGDLSWKGGRDGVDRPGDDFVHSRASSRQSRGSVFEMYGPPFPASVRALDAVSGRERFRAALTSAPIASVTAGDTLVVATEDGALRAIDARGRERVVAPPGARWCSDGAAFWRTRDDGTIERVDPPARAAAVANVTPVLGAAPAEILACGRAPAGSVLVLATSRGTHVVTTRRGAVHAHAAVTGGAIRRIAIAGSDVLVSFEDGTLRRIDAAAPAQTVEARVTGALPIAASNVAGDTLWVAVGSDVVALDRATLQPRR